MLFKLNVNESKFDKLFYITSIIFLCFLKKKMSDFSQKHFLEKISKYQRVVFAEKQKKTRIFFEKKTREMNNTNFSHLFIFKFFEINK